MIYHEYIAVALKVMNISLVAYRDISLERSLTTMVCISTVLIIITFLQIPLQFD